MQSFKEKPLVVFALASKLTRSLLVELSSCNDEEDKSSEDYSVRILVLSPCVLVLSQ